ncbi:MAG: DUF4380 domain-containing protein [Candidatus Omnitrophica bacterium]|nr:DUF4380 domain-containing protein [Candidatus Omnitrophota bacterium]
MGKESSLKIKNFELGNLILGVAEDIGPRILKLALKETPDKNLFGVLPDAGVETEEGFWHIYGGHRLWTSPEAMPRSYSMDNKPVKIETGKGYVRIYGGPEIQNSVQKEIEIRCKGKTHLAVRHRIKNIGRWNIKLACWALSVMRTGGFAIIPIKAGKKGLLPDRRISLWPYTHLSDNRLILEDDIIFVKQDQNAKYPFKIGTRARPCRTGYWVDGHLFVKEFQEMPGKYPDFGCSVEVYTNPSFLELETLSPLREVEPGQYIEHIEIWRIEKVPVLFPSSRELKKRGVVI